MADLRNSNLVLMSNMPDGTEPAHIYTRYFYNDESIEEIEEAYCVETPTGLYGGFFLHFKTPADAQEFAFQYSKTSAGDISHIHKKEIDVKVIPVSAAPKPDNVQLRLTDFLRDSKAMPRTKTVRIRGMVTSHPIRHVRKMCDDAFELYNPNGDPMWGPIATDRNPHLEHIVLDTSCLNDEVLVRLSSEEAASHIVSVYNGGYYNNATTYAVCVDDHELDWFLETEEGKTKNKVAHLFIPQVKPNASADTVRGMFAPYKVKDINMKPGERWAHVFLSEADAENFMKEFPKGKLYDGWFYKVRPSLDRKKGKGKRAGAGPNRGFQVPVAETAHTISENVAEGVSNLSLTEGVHTEDTATATTKPAPVSTKLRIVKLANNATEVHVRKLFDQFKINVEEIVLDAPQHQAIITLALDDIDTALLLTGKKILKRQILVEKV